MKDFIIKGCVIDSLSPQKLRSVEKGCIVVSQGLCRGVFREIPSGFEALPVTDFGEKLIIPGMCDLHLHAPQFALRGLGMDMELLDWLNTYIFPEEAKLQDPDYAKRSYGGFAEALRRSPTTRALVFATVHPQATTLLMELLEATGLICFVGKVNMDRNCPEYLREPSPEASLRATEQWLLETRERFSRTKPILTPRFIPSCSDALLQGLGELQRKYHVPVQSHLSENYGEIAWVRELSPAAAFYADAYDRFGLLGGDYNCVMAHCVHSGEEELERLRQRGVYIAHSPESNMNLASGVAPVSRYLDLGLRVGLATDVAAGSHLSMLRAISHAIQVSKLRWRLLDPSVPPLSFHQAFWLATLGSGSFFGRVGAFREGWEFDALVLDDSNLFHPQPLDPLSRLERAVYLGDDGNIVAKYVNAERLF